MEPSEQKYSVLKIEPQFKTYVIQFQSLIQSKTGKYISQGRAAGLACAFMFATIDRIPTKYHTQGKHDLAKTFDTIRESLLEFSNKYTEGDLKDFDIENLFDYS